MPRLSEYTIQGRQYRSMNYFYAIVVLITCAIASGCTKSSPTESTMAAPTPNTNESPGSDSNDHQASDHQAIEPTLLVAPSVGKSGFIGPLADAYERIDPERDGWQSEAFGATAGKQLARFGELLRESTSVSAADIEATLAADFSAAPLFTNEGRVVFHDHGIEVNHVDESKMPDTTGTARFGELQVSFRSRFSSPETTKLKFKVIRVDTSAASYETEVYFHANGHSPFGITELTATWMVNWEIAAQDSASPRIKSILVTNHENVTRPDSQEPSFADCTPAVLEQNASFADQLLRSTDYWRSRLPRNFGLDVVANHGLAIGDVNGDHLDDIYLCQQGGLPNRLYIQQPDGTLVDKSKEGGADWLDYCASALIVDLDNDGDRDLVVAEESLILFMENDGSGRFTLRSETNTLAQTFSITSADFDLDGDLDVFCCGYNPLADRVRTGAMGEPMPYHDAQNGGQNMLLKNEGDFKFTNVADDVGLGQNNNRFSFAASWEDFDNDGDSDLYVANDYGRNNLYRNDDGRFNDVAAELGVEDMSAGMSINWADFNRDGWMDFYVSNMFSAAGNRITFQRQFRSTEDAKVKQQYQRHARGNSLFQADSRGGFSDVSVPAGITMGRWAWGSRFCDINNDGWQDILVANGFITTEDTGDL